MSAKKWVITFILTALLLTALTAAFNYLTDPFGVFQKDLLNLPSFEMTMNPRTAKHSWLLSHKNDYDSYILGCSSTSSFPVDALNEAFGAKFYNMIVYGADMKDTELMARWLLDSCEVKNIVVNVYLDNALMYDLKNRALTHNMPCQMTGENPAAFYLKYLFCNPRYGADKIRNLKKDTYMPQSFDVFNEYTGCYNKIARDAEPISDTLSYLVKYPGFANYPYSERKINEGAAAGTYKSLAAIRDLCAERGVSFTLAAAPVYGDYLKLFPAEDVAAFYAGLAEISPFYDYSNTPFSYEPRYFYDETHFRNALGYQMLGEGGFKTETADGAPFGRYVTAESAKEYKESYFDVQPAAGSDITETVRVLMYHHIEEGAENIEKSGTISPQRFEEDMAALYAEGVNTVSPAELSDYVLFGKALPENPVLITFDDGYYSNYEYAYPVLKKYGFKAAIFTIGVSIGSKEHYKDTEYPITPHFGWEEAREMIDSGLITIGSHSYDMHQWPPYESGSVVRQTMMPLAGESEADYRAAALPDAKTMKTLFSDNLGYDIYCAAYPEGQYNALVTRTLQEAGFNITFSTEPGEATLVKYLPQSLLAIKREAR